MLEVLKTDSKNDDFIRLVKQLDAYLKVVDGDEHDFYAQFNGIDSLQNCIVVYENNIPVACGAFKPLDNQTVEVKRMFTDLEHRQKGFAGTTLLALEDWAKKLDYSKIRLETGRRMSDAVKFYTSKNYKVIPNYGQYIGIENSICFEKVL